MVCRLLFFLVAIVFTSAGGANAQSWSCRSPRNCTESIICASPQMQMLDEEMAGLYFYLQSHQSRLTANFLLEDQRRWLRQRDNCGCDANCLVGAYRVRIEEFRRLLQ